MRTNPPSLVLLALACAALAALLAPGLAGATVVGPLCGTAQANVAGCCCRATTTVVKTASLGTTTVTSLKVVRATVRVTKTATSTTFVATVVAPPRKAARAVDDPAGLADMVADLYARGEAWSPAGAALAPEANANGRSVCPRCPAAGSCCVPSVLTATRTSYRTLKTRSATRVTTTKVSVTARKTVTATVKVNAVGPWNCHKLAGARFVPLRTDPRSNAPACLKKGSKASCNGAVKGGFASCCTSFASRGACEEAANRLSAQAVGSASSAVLYSCPARYSLRTTNGTSHAGDCGESRLFLKFWRALGPLVHAFGGPQSAKAAAAAAMPQPRRARSLRRSEPPLRRRQAAITTASPDHGLERRNDAFQTTGMVIRLVNQDVPSTFTYGSEGTGGVIRSIDLGWNQCADIGAPLFALQDGEQTFSISVANQFTNERSSIGLTWTKPVVSSSSWATLTAGTGTTCCWGKPNATAQWFYAFNPYNKDVPAAFNKTYWTQQKQTSEYVQLPIPQWQQNFRGLGDVCLHNNGTVILGHPCQTGNNPNVANVQFLAMHTGAKRKTTGPYPPFSSPSRIWSRTDCIKLGNVAPAGYPSDLAAARPRGQVPTAVLGPAYRKLEPISDGIRVNSTVCTVLGEPCLVFVGTLRQAARKVASGQAAEGFLGYFLQMPGVADQFEDAITEAFTSLAELVADMGEVLGETVADMIEAINSLEPEFGDVFAEMGENDLWDMVGETAETTSFRRSFNAFIDTDVQTVSAVRYVDDAAVSSVADDAAVESMADTDAAVDEDASEDAVTDVMVDEFTDIAFL